MFNFAAFFYAQERIRKFTRIKDKMNVTASLFSQKMFSDMVYNK